jgi:hypothetical protein
MKACPIHEQYCYHCNAPLLNITSDHSEHILNDNVNPSHYQGYFEDLQWLETMCRIEPFTVNPDKFEGALELQIRKYLDRKGKKDKDIQEVCKALWYMKFLTAWLLNDKKPIKVSEINNILKDI